MIDIHHHCLHGVDDGPKELAEAVEMCAMAAEEGIETIVATPHVLRGRWPAHSPDVLAGRADELRARTGDRPRLVLGSEYFFGHDMAELLRAGTSIIPLAGSRYVLFELVANALPPMITQPLYSAQLDGWAPVIAHPERNSVLQSHPDLLAELVYHGARAQITATSLTGEFGAAAQRAAETFLRRRLVHFVATDAHGATRRPPRVRHALEVLRQLCGDETAEALTRLNPAAVLRNEALPWDPPPEESPNPGIFARAKAFFTSR